LGIDYIDLYQLHGFDALSPIEETLSTLDDMVHSGQARYVGCSNFSGWHLMKSLAVSEKYGLSRYVAHQAYYSLIGRDYEWELMPLALDQKVGTVVWSPLGWGRLTGRMRRGQPLPEISRLRSQAVVDAGPPVADEYVYRVVDAIDEVAKGTGKTVPQIAINWLLRTGLYRGVANDTLGAASDEYPVDLFFEEFFLPIRRIDSSGASPNFERFPLYKLHRLKVVLTGSAQVED
jgi:aryl-alcohol dehydrogenase-like predicted oxidoreductase